MNDTVSRGLHLRGLERLLLVDAGERRAVSYFFALFVLLGLGLAIGRGSADALFLKRYGIEHLPVAFGLLAAALAAVSLVYAAFADRLSAERLLRGLLVILIALLVIAWALIVFTAVQWVYPAYFILHELGSEILLLHAALYLGQNFDPLQGQRLFPVIFGGAQVGLIGGGLLLAGSVPLVGVTNMPLIWCALAGLAVALIWSRHRQAGVSPYYRPGRKGVRGAGHAIEQVVHGLRFLRSHELVRASCYALFFMVIAFFVLSYAVHRVYTQAFASEIALGAFFGWLTAATGLTALAFQLLVTGRLLRRFGVRRLHLVYPSASALSYVALLASYAFPAALVGSFAKDVLMPAIRRPVRNLMLDALPERMRGRVRALSVAIVLPAALATAAGLLILAQWLEQPAYFLAIGLLASVLYLYCNLRVNRAYVATLLATLRERLFVPGNDPETLVKGGADDAVFAELRRGVVEPDTETCEAYARMLVGAYPERGAEVILDRMANAPPALRDRLLRLLLSADALSVTTLWGMLDGADAHLRATLLGALFERRAARAAGLVGDCLASANPRLVAVGIQGASRYAEPRQQALALRRWSELLTSNRAADNLAGLELLTVLPASAPAAAPVGDFLTHPNDHVRRAALRGLAAGHADVPPDLGVRLRTVLDESGPAVRALCIECLGRLPPAERDALIELAVRDPHPAVRAALARALGADDGYPVDRILGWLVDTPGSPRAQDALLTALIARRPARSILERIAEAKVREATVLSEARAVLRNDAPGDGQVREAVALMEIVVGERLQGTVDLALRALGQVEQRDDVAAIRGALASADRQQVARAIEALRHFSNERLGARLAAILAGNGAHERRATRGAADVLRWCRTQPDAWMRACAERALEMLQPPGGTACPIVSRVF